MTHRKVSQQTEEPASERIDDLYGRLLKEAEASGYHLNPDREFTKELVRGLLINSDRYGYLACPCRLAEGMRKRDLDIICPCDYRDPDLKQYGTCYCALYVSADIADGRGEAGPIPDRRPMERGHGKSPDRPTGRRGDGVAELSHPVWRCPVCGYLCAREDPPDVCPICKADGDRFERFM
jgi:ferredoxin-thioredoxin reductase catalytic subunit